LIRFVVSDATDEEQLLDELGVELVNLSTTSISQVETTLLIHPSVFENFLDFNDFLTIANKLVAALRLSGVIQIASFHPHYQFEGTAPGDVENFTNRSPFPMLHLLREESITRAVGDRADHLQIPRRNIELLRGLGAETMRETLNRITSTDAI
jgi:hypothetical protein